MAQLFLNNFESVFVASVKSAPESSSPASELGYGILRLSDGAAGRLSNPSPGDWYMLTAFKRSGTGESDYEIMRITAVDNAAVGECRIYVERGQDGTTPQSYTNGDPVEMRLTAGTLQNLIQQADPALSAPRAPTGAAGGVLAGVYPNPTFREAMATQAQLATKVDKVAGKMLSANDLTNELLIKLTGIAEQATKNDTNANLRARSTHTGTQAIATVAGLSEALDASKQRSNHAGTQEISTIAGLPELLQTLAPLFSPAFLGVPTVPTAEQGSDGGQIANTRFVQLAVDALAQRLLGDAPIAALDTLAEFGRAIGNDADFAATTTVALAGKVDKVAGKGLSSHDLTDLLLAKLQGIASGATANAADEQLRDRATHTGVQPIQSVAGLPQALASKQPQLAYEYSNSAYHGQPFRAHTLVALYTEDPGARSLPERAEYGDRIVLYNAGGTWSNGVFTVSIPANVVLHTQRAVLTHADGGMLLDTSECMSIELVCVWMDGQLFHWIATFK